jgi:hypothetical protein
VRPTRSPCPDCDGLGCEDGHGRCCPAIPLEKEAGITLQISVSDLPAFKELYEAVHGVLVARLMHGRDSKEFLVAINRLIDAHDAIAQDMATDD